MPKGVTECQNSLCRNMEHRKASDDHMLDILCAMEEAATENLTSSNRGNEKETESERDKLGKASDSSNYRSIAISSIILKLLDWVIILLYKDSLHLDTLQFSYQLNCTTTMCTWMIIVTIGYFWRNNSEVFICTMDITKAFAKVKHSILFQKLL